MSLVSKTLIPLLSFFLILLMLANNVRSQYDITSFQYDTFEPKTEGLTYERNAFVPSGSSYLSLIGSDASGKPLKNSVGRVLYSTPVNFSKPGRAASFETNIRFLIRTYDYDPVDGMTFFIIPVKSTRTTGGDGERLGIFDAVPQNTPIFAVEFDIFANPGYDPNFRHIGIDINSRTSRNVTCFECSLDQVTNVRINYYAPTRRINVVATYGSGNIRTVSYVYDLKTLLPQQVQVGISASTGPTRAADFIVYSWNFTSTLFADDTNTGTGTCNIKQVVM